MLRSLFSVFALTAFALGISATSSAQVTGCTNPIACNYNVNATVDNGLCEVPVYYVSSASVLQYDCDFLEFDTMLDQECAQTVIANDPFCINNVWDTACQSAYSACCPSGGSWFIPNPVFDATSYTPMVFACEAPENYSEIEEQYSLAFAVVYTSCFYTNWTADCDQLYNVSAFGCESPNFWIPVYTSGTYAVIQSCTAPVGAFVPADAECIGSVFANDPFCFATAWDNVCQASYNECIAGCQDAAWYLPIPGIYEGNQPVLACTPPVGLYFLADASCVETLAEVGPDPCFSGGWVIECNVIYDACIGDECGVFPGYQVPIPGLISDNVVITSCTAIEGYIDLGAQEIYSVYQQDVSCYFGWDQGCWDILAEIWNCEAVGWHVPMLGNSSLPSFGCGFGNQVLVPTSCFAEVIDYDSFCFENAWDSICWEAMNDCLNGCTYPIACNYSPNAINDDQSCTFPGCTDPTALNYLAYAVCDDGTCIFDSGQSCTGDLNSDGVVNVTDLTTFLSVFGSTCND